MTTRVWDTREAPPPDFIADWETVLKRAPHANFSLTVPCVCWEARHGRHALALIVDRGGQRGICLLRRAGRGFVSGWSWRIQAVVADPHRGGPIGLTPDECRWLFAAAVAVAAPRRVQFHLPHAAPPPVPSYTAGPTLLYAIDRDDQELLAAMQPSKRRMIVRAERAGYHVRDADGHEDLLRFAHLQRETRLRRGLSAPPVMPDPAPGQDWREWELPWMWLLLAERNGAVESGLGDGLCPGGMIDARAGASTLEGRRNGVFALLSLEEARRARDLGYRWLNLGGDTAFKREMAGRLASRVWSTCWLGGPGWWTWSVRAGLLWRRTAGRVGRFARSLGTRTRVVVWILLIHLTWDVVSRWSVECPWMM